MVRSVLYLKVNRDTDHLNNVKTSVSIGEYIALVLEFRGV